MKNKLMVICGAVLAVILVVALIFAMLPKTEPKSDPDKSSSTSGTSSNVVVEIEEIEETDKNGENDTNNNAGAFIEPSESEADKLIEENKKANGTSSDTKAEETKKEPENTTSNNTNTQTFEDSKKELEKTAKDYLKEHNIDPKTAGETGEVCAHCGKKIWNPDKYGLFIPGMPDNYEASGYCLGTCGITFG